MDSIWVYHDLLEKSQEVDFHRLECLSPLLASEDPWERGLMVMDRDTFLPLHFLLSHRELHCFYQQWIDRRDGRTDADGE